MIVCWKNNFYIKFSEILNRSFTSFTHRRDSSSSLSNRLRRYRTAKGGFRTAGRPISFARPKEMGERKGRPEPPTPSSASRWNRRSPNSQGAIQHASGSIKSLANTPIPAAMLGGGYGG